MVLVHSDDGALARVDGFLLLVGALGDPVLYQPALDARDHPALGLDFLDERRHPGFHPGGEVFEVVGAPEGVRRVDDACFLGDDLLGAQGEQGAFLAREGEGFIVGAGEHGLHPAEHRGEGLVGDAHDVVLGLGGGQRAPAADGAEAELPAPLVLGAEALAHDPGPEAAHGPVLGDFLEKIRVRVEIKAEPGGEIVHVHPARYAVLGVHDGVGEGEAALLDGGGPGVPEVRARRADGVEARGVGGAVLDGIDDEPEGGPGGEYPGSPRDVLFQYVVLDGPGDLRRWGALFFRHGDVHGVKNRRRRVDGERGADLAEGDVFKEGFHVGEGVDGDADLAHLSLGAGAVAVQAELGGQVEGDREAGVALVKQKAVAKVGFLGGAEARVLARGP